MLAAACGTAAAAAKTKMEDTVAVVNGTPILLSEYQKEASTALDYWSKTNPAAMADPVNARKIRENTLEELITRELLVQEGQKLKLKVREREIENAVDEIKARFKKDETGRLLTEAQADETFQRQLQNEGLDFGRFRERLSRQILARKVIDEQVKARTAPAAEKEVRDYFEKIKSYIASKSTEAPKGLDEEEGLALREAAAQVKTMSSERVRVYRILIRVSASATDNERKRALKTAAEIKRRLDGGEEFTKVAKEESEEPESAARGGDIGYVLRGVAPPELEKAVFSMGVGEISAPIATEVGYHIVRVTEKRADETPDFDRFKDDLANFLGNVSFQKRLESFVQGLREKSVIERHLPTTP
ncbi:MAG: hypothetical protein A2X40_09295 [Elusimicrobia bacterium GWC2_65_9]|nr:MAG: hypothetical protein A2X37_01055 [Elusimicrobia bacterium GWA2_66_18]OGR70467.1 MAG: hypothetical protein A2X40_09295 [Elusimicrobia bacterium GWC2_65_9]